MNKLRILFLGALLAIGFASAFENLLNPAPVSALQAENIETFTGSINAETTVITGTASTNLRIRSMDIASSVSGIVVFRDGTAGAVVLETYIIANTPKTLTKLMGGTGLECTQNLLTAELAGATLTLTARTYDD